MKIINNNLSLAIIILILILLSHWGANEYLSFQFLSFIFAIFIFKSHLVSKLLNLLLIGSIYFVIISVGYYFGDHEINTYLRACRAALVAAFLFTMRGVVFEKLQKLFYGFYVGVYFACVISLFLASLQLVDSLLWSRGYFDVPMNWYSLEYGTLFSDSRESLYGTGYFIRPSGFFSEPSALVALGILGLFCSHVAKEKFKIPFYRNISLALMIVPFSMNGFVILPFAMLIYGENGKYKKTILYFAVILIAVLVLYNINDALNKRINLIFAGEDISASIRILEPINVIKKILGDGFLFGVSQDLALSYAAGEVYSVFNNWMFNQIIFYGVFGLILIAIPFIMLDKKIWLIIFSYMVLNGEIFYYDRFFMLLCAVIINDFFMSDEFKRDAQVSGTV